MSELMPEGQPIHEPAPVVEPEQEQPFAISPQEWEGMQQQQGYLLEQVGQIARALQPSDELQPPDNSLLSPEEWEYVRQLNQQQIQQAVGPLYQMREQYTQDVGSDLARDILSDETTRNGDFVFKGSFDKALTLADREYLPQAIQQYGENMRAAEAAVAQAAADVRAWEQEVGEAYYERKTNHLRGIQNAPRQPPVGGTSAIEPHTLPEGKDLRSVVRAHFG